MVPNSITIRAILPESAQLTLGTHQHGIKHVGTAAWQSCTVYEWRPGQLLDCACYLHVMHSIGDNVYASVACYRQYVVIMQPSNSLGSDEFTGSKKRSSFLGRPLKELENLW